MNRVDKLSFELAEAIIESEEYKNYIRCKDEISKNPQLNQAVNDLRKHNFQLQNTDLELDMYEEVVKIFDRYAYIRTNVAANQFLRAELSMCRMIQDIQRTIVENMDFDMDFIN